MIEADVRDFLVANAGVSTRVYPGHLPQTPTLPAVVYNRISGSSELDLGIGGGLTESLFQVDSYAATYSEVKNVVAAIVAALESYVGTAFKVTAIDTQDAPYEDGVNEFRAVTEFRIFH